VHPAGSTAGHAQDEQSGRGAANSPLVTPPIDPARLAAELAQAFLTAPAWNQTTLAEVAAAALGAWPPWVDSLAFILVGTFRSCPVDEGGHLHAAVLEILRSRPDLATPGAPPALVTRAPGGPPRTVAVTDWPVTPIASVPELAQRLELSLGQLEWLADVRGAERTVEPERLRNYRYAVVRRRSGLPRIIEAPKARLKEIQRWILREVLAAIPLHNAVHGFVTGRSVLTHADAHVSRPVVLSLDLRDFFASVPARRVFGIFRLAGYPSAVAHALTGLCTNCVPQRVWNAVGPADPSLVGPRFWLGRQLATPHLPQGAPTSPTLANLAAFRLDRRLAGLSRAWGLSYSRYADDLVLSGSDLLRHRRRLLESLIAEIVREEGFAVHADKSRLRTAASRQAVCGVVVNAHRNVTRRDYDQLKAILHNAARLGPASQNRDGVADFRAHLRGRIAWVAQVNPSRGERLLDRFAAIDWSR
jgi:RNA-directed DNA polymerase